MTGFAEKTPDITHSTRTVEVAVALGVTTTVSYGTLYYAFGVVARDMSTDTGLSLTSVYGIFSFGLFLSGFLATRAGKLFDDHDPATIMAIGSALSIVLLTLWSLTTGQWAFTLLLVALQMTSMLVMYEAAFVAAAHYSPATARRTITGITLIAGFASTIFWPLTAWLRDFWSWREIYLLFALLHVLFGLLPHIWLSRRYAGQKRSNVPESEAAETIPPRIQGARARKRAVFLMIIGFAANAFVIAAVHLHMIGLLEAVGLAASAAMIGALIGPSQVAGRIIEFTMSARVSIFSVTLFSAAALPVALLLLVVAAPWTFAAIIFAVLFGLGQGLAYIARGVFPLELFGTTGYGHLTGRINAVRLYVSAGAPFVTAAILEQAGVTTAIYAIVFAGVAGLAALAAIGVVLRNPND